MTILILEDSQFFLELFISKLKNTFITKNATIHYLTSTFENIDYSIKYDIIFIDILLNSNNGIELAKTLKEKYPKALIIFMTSNNGLVFKTLELQPFFFIRKKFLDDDFEICMHLIEKHLHSHYTIALTNREKTVHVNIEDIVYAESEGHYLNIATIDQQFRKKIKLKDFEQQLQSEKFVQVHRSYLINMDYILNIKNGFITLVNQKQISIGASFKQNFKNKYQEFLINDNL